MAEFHRLILLCLFLLTWSVSATETAPKDLEEKKEEEKEELLETETRDGKLEIIKKIKKINGDGSYTIGYEADDGSFKIESRDVLGHIKGTYGFVDEDGNLKRVSYSSGNATGTPVPPGGSSTRYPETSTSGYPATTSSTRYPGTSSTRSPAPSATTNNVVQSIAKRRSTTSTSKPPNYTDVVNVFPSAHPPRVLLQGRSEGQLARPDVVTVKPTVQPLKTLTLRRLEEEEEKPVHEESEQLGHGRTNILRRQLGGRGGFDAREEASRLRQSIGHDHADVYSSSMTTGHPKPPLFTTTSRPRLIPVSTTPVSVSVARPYPIHYQKSQLVEVTPSADPHTTQLPRFPGPQVPKYPPPQAIPSPAPVVQIPATSEEPEQLVAVRHQKGTVLVPISHLQQGRLVPFEDVYQPEQKVVEIEQQKAIVRKLPQLRPIPVQVDEDGYIREVARPYQVPIPSEVDNSVDEIQPPVSTRDFHKLLQQLILRQSRLEKISALTKHPEIYLQMQQHNPRPIYRMIDEPVHYVQQQPQQHSFDDHYESYRPNRRVARLQPRQEEYLPSNVREMLLLRMLQLAINPALPVDEPQEAMEHLRKPVRNVEILGEEQEPAEGRRRRSGKARVYEKVY